MSRGDSGSVTVSNMFDFYTDPNRFKQTVWDSTFLGNGFSNYPNREP